LYEQCAAGVAKKPSLTTKANWPLEKKAHTMKSPDEKKSPSSQDPNKPKRVLPPKGNTLAQAIFSTSYAWELERLRERGLDGTGTVFAILDTAIDRGHPAFLQKKNIPEIFNFLEHHPIASTEHGNVCAAVAVGSSYNTPSTNVPSGVAPGAQLIVYRVAEDGCSCNNAVLRALDDIKVKTESGIQIDVVSISYDLNEDNEEEIRWKIKELTEKCVVFVAAAGNRGCYQPRASIPACFDSVISVGALDTYGDRSRFNPGGRIDVYAPGEDIPTPSSTSDTFRGDFFCYSCSRWPCITFEAVGQGSWATSRRPYP